MCHSWTQDVVSEKAPCSRFQVPYHIHESWKSQQGWPRALMLRNPTRMFMLNSDLRWGQGNFLPLEKWVWKRGVSNCDHKPFCAAEIRPKTLLRVGLCLHACNNSTGLTLPIGIWIHNITTSWELFPILWDGWWSILTSAYTQSWALWGTTLNMKWQQMCSILYEGHQHNTVHNFFFFKLMLSSHCFCGILRYFPAILFKSRLFSSGLAGFLMTYYLFLYWSRLYNTCPS